MWTEAVTEELSKPLDRKHVKPPPKGKYGDYVEAHHVIREANRIFGFDGWSYAVTQLCKTNDAVKGETLHVGYTAMVRLTVGDVQREDVGHGQGHSKSAGDAHDSAVKEAVTDAVKRCLRTFGDPFGLALYDKAKTNVVDFDAEAEKISKACEWIEASATVDEVKDRCEQLRIKRFGGTNPKEVEDTADNTILKITEDAA